MQTILLAVLCVVVILLVLQVRQLKDDVEDLEERQPPLVEVPNETIPATLQMQLRDVARDAARHAIDVHVQELHQGRR